MTSLHDRFVMIVWLLSVCILILQGDGFYLVHANSRRLWGMSKPSTTTTTTRTSSPASFHSHPQKAALSATSVQSQQRLDASSDHTITTTATSNSDTVGTTSDATATNSVACVGNDGSDQDTTMDESPTQAKNDNAIEVSASIELPFPKGVAFDAFSDLSRQSTFSPWLKSVEYLNGEKNGVGSLTRWKLSYLGLRFSWNAVSTVQDRKNGILEWKSITGLQNNGRVVFHEIDHERSYMNMTMSFSIPRLAARLMGPTKLATIVEKRILENTVRNFRQIVAENDWKMKQLEDHD
jgi:uncharacterized membrane protein